MRGCPLNASLTKRTTQRTPIAKPRLNKAPLSLGADYSAGSRRNSKTGKPEEAHYRTRWFIDAAVQHRFTVEAVKEHLGERAQALIAHEQPLVSVPELHRIHTESRGSTPNVNATVYGRFSTPNMGAGRPLPQPCRVHLSGCTPAPTRSEDHCIASSGRCMVWLPFGGIRGKPDDNAK